MVDGLTGQILLGMVHSRPAARHARSYIRRLMFRLRKVSPIHRFAGLPGVSYGVAGSARPVC